MTIKSPRQPGGESLLLAMVLILASCTPRATPTIFIPPSQAPQPPPPVTMSIAGSEASPTGAAIIFPTVILPSPTPACTNTLTYVQDLTIPDGSNVAPGQPIDKEWQVLNSGTCNWDQRYGLKLISGDPMGANSLQPLYPARAGTQATLRILFTAPQSAGLYQCQWQAVDPDGQPFGDAFYMQISVTP